MSAAIRALHWGKLPTAAGLKWRHTGGALYGIWPAPFPWDACFQQAGFADFSDGDEGWDAEWDSLIAAAVANLAQHFGQVQLIAEDNPRRGLLHNLASKFLPHQRATRLSELSPVERLLWSTCDDQIPCTMADFGQEQAVRLRTSDGHRVLWISAAPGTAFDAAEFATSLAAGRVVRFTELEWGDLAG
jgi:hypothetical protein